MGVDDVLLLDVGCLIGIGILAVGIDAALFAVGLLVAAETKLEHSAVITESEAGALDHNPLAGMIVVVKGCLSNLQFDGAGLILDEHAAVDVAGTVFRHHLTGDDDILINLYRLAENLIESLQLGDSIVGDKVRGLG